jgi:pimeloyl-ACP methyl ester carboxylesterase
MGGRGEWIECRGSGSPTIVLEAGLNSNRSAWAEVFRDLAAFTRTCRHERPGIGSSDPRLDPGPLTAGAMAAETHALLEAVGVEGPYVLVGHSYGGMLVRLFAAAHPEEVSGVVLIDASSGHQFEVVDLSDPAWVDGGTEVDVPASAAQLASVKTLGSMPLAVLTEGDLIGPFEGTWAAYQDELATLSTDALHMVATQSGHFVQEDRPELVIATVRAVLEAASAGQALPPCGPAYEAVGAECLATTMTDRFEGWKAVRDAVAAIPGTLPDGIYKASLSGPFAAGILGRPAPFRVADCTWTVGDGRWSVLAVVDGIDVYEANDVYAAAGDEVVFRLPAEWKVPRTPGVNRFRWTVDAAGTLTFEQLDDELADPKFAIPWIRTGDAPER